MANQRLSAQDIDTRLGDLPGWRVEDDKLSKTFVFADFVQAFGWMTKVAIQAERLNHHPNWSNVYKTVDVTLWTHDASGLTESDFKLAALMNKYA